MCPLYSQAKLREIGFITYALGKPLDPFIQVRTDAHPLDMRSFVYAGFIPVPGISLGLTPAILR